MCIYPEWQCTVHVLALRRPTNNNVQYLGQFALGQGLCWLAHGEVPLGEWLWGMVGQVLAPLTVDHVLNKRTSPCTARTDGLQIGEVRCFSQVHVWNHCTDFMSVNTPLVTIPQWFKSNKHLAMMIICCGWWISNNWIIAECFFYGSGWSKHDCAIKSNNVLRRSMLKAGFRC